MPWCEFYADQRVLENHQWFEIVLEESSFYTLQLTTQTLGNEISHFVGQKTRCSEKRKEPDGFIDVLGLGHSKVTLNDVEAEKVIKASKDMFKITTKIIPDYDLEIENRTINLEGCIYLLVIYVNASIFKLLLDFVMESLSIEIQKQLLVNTIDSSEHTIENMEELLKNIDFFVKQAILVSIDELLPKILTEYHHLFKRTY